MHGAEHTALEGPRPARGEFTVSEFAASLKRVVEEDFGHVRIRGEISSYRGVHTSGHCYFCLKDDRAKLEAVIWRTSFPRLQRHMVEGLEVVATGRVTIFPAKSTYQIVVESLEPAGVGALMAMLEERRRRLAAEGLFDQARKRALPFLPRVVGVVTSPTGAVIRDILHRLSDRFPVRVLVWPVRVQGDTSASEVAAAIRGFNALPCDGAPPRPDLLIVARGGGSLEDLWGFNDESVVRATAESRIPVISAVGHETDWTLIDHAADHRAPTPTAAAERAVPVRRDLADLVASHSSRLHHALLRSTGALRGELLAAQRGLGRAEDLVSVPRQVLDHVSSRLPRALVSAVREVRARLGQTAARLVWRDLQRVVTLRRDRSRELDRRRSAALGSLLAVHRRRFDVASARLRPALGAARFDRERDRVGNLVGRGRRAVRVRLREQSSRLGAAAKLLSTLGYTSVLARGFALVWGAGGRPVRRAADASAGMAVQVELADGRFGALVTGEGAGRMRRKARRDSVPEQAGLFDELSREEEPALVAEASAP